jgi:signal transduction histidine kinase
MNNPQKIRPSPSLSFLVGGGEMGERIRAFDWARTRLGAPENWPQSLRSAISIMLPSKAQILLIWGPDLITFYNDAYRPVFGDKHPRVLGIPVREAWSELWENGLKALFEGVLTTGEAFWASDRLFVVSRFGFTEETYFDVSYDPVRVETGDVGGVFCIVTETTGRVVGERRLRTLRELSARTVGAQAAGEACEVAANILAENPYDVPFVLIYLLEPNSLNAILTGSAGLEASPAAPKLICLGSSSEEHSGKWPLESVFDSGRIVVVPELTKRFGALSAGAWPEPPHTAVVLPIRNSGQERCAGFLIAGVSPRRPLDEQYKAFYELLASQIGTAVSNARAYEAESKRAEALAELDRAKTAFFSNVSHEFRTPLTLMMAPVEDALADRERLLQPADRERLEIVHRNGLRLQRLVNTLLDFSRIEAGRVKANYERTDLAAFTAELASNFRSACERAGIVLEVHCPPQAEPVYVDWQMWEKIVLNLLSNAFKFTFEGTIEVALHTEGNRAVLRVRDTGTGIPPEEMPRLFERFHRIENARARTFEGTGIGLALVQELVKLHGGSIAVQSILNEGTTFTVSIPLGSGHLPAEQVGQVDRAAGLDARPYLEEILSWLPSKAADTEAQDPHAYPLLSFSSLGLDDGAFRPRVLIADDNADMRQYLHRVLSQEFQVDTVADGEAALESIQERHPDLVVADVMMPRLDGFGLLKQLRTDPETAQIPFILLSARAGEESRIEGLEAGADDYLVKPFGARELLVRVDAHIKMTQLRRRGEEALRASEKRLAAELESTSRLHEILKETDRRKDEFLAMLAHELRNPLAPLRNGLQMLKLDRNNPANIELCIGIMDRQLMQMIRLVEDLMDVNRITRGRIELRKETIEITRVVQQAVETSMPSIEKGSHELILDLPTEPVFIEGDLARLAQVLSNLLNNASKYTEPGGRITLTIRSESEAVTISVRDTGMGIPGEMLSQVFDMFTQLDHSLERTQGGLGIGLTLVKRLVEMHGGTISAHSEGSGTGSEFIIRLPVFGSPPYGSEAETTSALTRVNDPVPS